jgi:hypothetical protein
LTEGVLEHGDVWTYLPPDISEEQAHAFLESWRPFTPHGPFPTVSFPTLDDTAFREVLSHVHSVAGFESAYAIVEEEPAWQSKPFEKADLFTYGDDYFYFRRAGQLDLDDLTSALSYHTNGQPWVMFSALVPDGHAISDWTEVSTPTLLELARGTFIIVLRAYDSDSLVVWERRS